LQAPHGAWNQYAYRPSTFASGRSQRGSSHVVTCRALASELHGTYFPAAVEGLAAPPRWALCAWASAAGSLPTKRSFPAKKACWPGLGLSARRRMGRLLCFAFDLWLIAENPFACAGYVQTRTGLAVPMKDGIHPAYVVTTVTCSCGNTFVTRSTKKEIRVDICSACHPFFTGKLKYVDTAGRIEKFQSKFAAGTYNSVQKPAAKAAKKRKPAPTTEEY